MYKQAPGYYTGCVAEAWQSSGNTEKRCFRPKETIFASAIYTNLYKSGHVCRKGVYICLPNGSQNPDCIYSTIIKIQTAPIQRLVKSRLVPTLAVSLLCPLLRRYACC